MTTSLAAMVDLRGDTDGGLTLSWTEAPGASNKPVPASEVRRLRDLAEAVSHAETRAAPVAIVAARLSLSRALFDLLDGPERALSQRIDAAEDQRRRLDLVVRAITADRRDLREHPATWMRWELLPLAEMERRGSLPLSVVLQLGGQKPAAPRVLPRGGLRVLFMASSPETGAPELDFEHEEEALLAALAPQAEKRRARLRVVEEGALEDLRVALLDERFDVVHLSGHGRLTPEGPRLVMEDTFGGAQLVSPEELIDVLRGAKQVPELVMVSSCHSAEVRGSVASFAAELVAAGVPNVLGWTRPVRDDLATFAASAIYEQLGASKTPAEAAEVARDRMRRAEAKVKLSTHDWGTLHLVSGAAGDFHLDDGAAPLSERVDRDDLYKYLGGKMRVLKAGFVGRRRLLQRLLRAVLRGAWQRARDGGLRDVAGACVYGMKGAGKSCAVGRAIERAAQHAPGLRVVVVHGAIDERGLLEAFHQAIRAGAPDEQAEAYLGRADEPASRRVARVMDHWRRQHVALVLDDFEQNLEPRENGPWLLSPTAAALLEAILPACAAGKPKLLLTSTAEFAMPAGHERALAFVPLGSFDDAAIHKLWIRGQASNELASVSLASWRKLAARLGGNARILAWARALLAGRRDEELAAVAEKAAAALPVWKLGDDASEEKHAELARLFLKHMAYDEARAAFGEDVLAFVKRARVFDAAVPAEAFAALAEGLAVDLARDLDALASRGLMEVGELDGARAYRVSPLVEPALDVEDPARWHEAASAAWEALADKATRRAARLERIQAAWEHALHAKLVERADRLARVIHKAHHDAGLYADNLRLAERHVEALPESPFGHEWAGYAEFTAGRPAGAAKRVERGLALLIAARGTEEHPEVAASLHALGGVLMAQGDLAGARRAMERAQTILVKVLGTEEHASVAASLHELGRVLRAQGDLAGARRAMERSLEIEAKVLGTEEHPEVAASLHVLGAVLMAQGDLAGARRALERSLAILAKVLGTEEHPHVAVSLQVLGSVLMAQGDLAGARHALERSLAMKVKVLGTEEHPEVAVSLHELGRVLMAQGDLAGARRTLERTLEIDAKVLGTEEHPSIATSLHELARILQSEGELEPAVQHYRRVLRIDEKCFGTLDQYYSAETEVALARLLFKLDQAEEARALIEHALRVFEEQVPTHPYVPELRAIAAGWQG